MGKVLKHPLRAMGAALTIVGAGIVFVVFFIPMATAGPKPPGGGKGPSSPGKNAVDAYVNDHGNVLHEVGPDQEFTILGENLNFAHDASWGVQCWNGKFWTEVSNWDYGPDSRTLVDVDMNNDCSGMLTQIRVNSDTTSKGDHYAYGPMIYVK
jgi:hypothetical protein